MRTEKFLERHPLGLERLTGDNSGLYYTNERTESNIDSENVVQTHFVYDVYEVNDARYPDKVKSEIIKEQYPHDRELKILRNTIAKLLRNAGKYDTDDFAEFKKYNEFSDDVVITDEKDNRSIVQNRKG